MAKSVEELIIPSLPNKVHVQKLDDFRHNDFVWGKEAKSKIYDNIVKLLSKNKK